MKLPKGTLLRCKKGMWNYNWETNQGTHGNLRNIRELAQVKRSRITRPALLSTQHTKTRRKPFETNPNVSKIYP